jgi:predicted transcriptional regulator
VLEHLADPPSRTSVRTFLRILEDKGHLRHVRHGREYLYRPVRPRSCVGRSALMRVLETFYGGSLEQAVAAHLADPSGTLSEREMERLSRLLREARKKGGRS